MTLTKRLGIPLLYLAISCLGGWLPAQIQDSPWQLHSEAAQPRPEEMDELVRQLASPVFAVREQATQSLLEIGQPALKTLREVPTDDFERFYRASWIAKRIEDDRFEELSRGFLLDANPLDSYGLPAWAPFSKLAGSTRTCKLLFLEMVRKQPELSALMDQIADAQSTGRPAKARDIELLTHQMAAEAARIRQQRMHLQTPEIGDIVAILMATSLIEGQTPIEVNELLDTSAHTVPISSYAVRRGYRSAIRQLYAQWIPKTHDAMAFKALYLSLSDGLETGGELARKYLSANYDVSTRELAISCIARFGDPTDIPRLLELFQDETIGDEFRGSELPNFRDAGIDVSDAAPPGIPSLPRTQEDSEANEKLMMYRMQDLALAAAMVLQGDDPESIFPEFRRHELMGFVSRSVAVPKDPAALKQRAKQIEQWKARYQSQIAGG